MNGGLECGVAGNAASLNRQRHYTRLAARLGLDITGEQLDCSGQASFTAAGAASSALYWDPDQVGRQAKCGGKTE